MPRQLHGHAASMRVSAASFSPDPEMARELLNTLRAGASEYPYLLIPLSALRANFLTKMRENLEFKIH
jgi:hypothetical protein